VATDFLRLESQIRTPAVNRWSAEGVEGLIARLHALGVEDLSMTTNGSRGRKRCDRLLPQAAPH